MEYTVKEVLGKDLKEGDEVWSNGQFIYLSAVTAGWLDRYKKYLVRTQAEEDKWISVEKELPKIGKCIVCTSKKVFEAYHNGKGIFLESTGEDRGVRTNPVSFWQPLPNHPKK